MSADPNKKSARTFQCRDVLWETFEQMARELECSVDYLVNEAMKQYARQRSYGGSRTPYPSAGRGPESPPADRSPTATPSSGRLSAEPSQPQAGRLPPPAAPARQGQAGVPSAGRAAGGLAAPPPRGQPSSMPPVPRSAPPPPLPHARSLPPPLPRSSAPAARSSVAPVTNGSHLTLLYNGARHSITKDRFVIGRGKQSSDLTLKDPNVSRQHAMVEFQNGIYFMVDMGSTNGVAINGQRIARKQISEGDVFRICDHDIQFTYR
jgi:hypothetical protein